jgi:hypothetical protein
VIGVGKKSCLCCYWLAQLLGQPPNDPFLVAGTHGMVFPWTPPSFGTPDPILEQLEKRSILKLTEATEMWIDSQVVAPSSRQSSPASRSSDDPSDYIPAPSVWHWDFGGVCIVSSVSAVSL